MKIIQDYTQKELLELVKPSFRAKQIWGWIYHKYAKSFDEMGNLPKDLKEQLSNEYTLSPLEIVMAQKSSDGSIKYLFRLHDGHTI
jgi:23S rRNA (adenine2503-C2)-methyltransferase